MVNVSQMARKHVDATCNHTQTGSEVKTARGYMVGRNTAAFVVARSETVAGDLQWFIAAEWKEVMDVVHTT